VTGGEPVSTAELVARLAEIERHLRDAPPHSAAGLREDLTTRRDELRRRLAAISSAP
jgi:hypothetical protein